MSAVLIWEKSTCCLNTAEALAIPSEFLLLLLAVYRGKQRACAQHWMSIISQSLFPIELTALRCPLVFEIHKRLGTGCSGTGFKSQACSMFGAMTPLP